MTDRPNLSENKRLLLERLRRGEGGIRDAALTPRPPGAPVPMTPEQSYVWLHAAMAPDLPLYNEPVMIRRRGPFDRDAFERAFNELVRRHEIWRTAFAIGAGGEPEQVVLPELWIPLPLTDLGHLPEAQREAAALRLAEADARRPIDPAAPPLMRPRLVRLADDDHRLFLTLQHLIFDGVTLSRVLMPELAAAYEAFAAGRAPTLPPLPLQFGDYAAWRARRSEHGEAARLEEWRRRLADLPVLDLPVDRPRPVASSHRGGLERFELSPELTAALRAVGRREGATLYAVLLAGFTALLHRYSGQDDVVVGSVTDTRSRPELQALMGYFLNTVVLRTRPTSGLTFREHLAQTRETALSAMAAADVPFHRVVRALAPERDPGRHPLFQVMFSMQPRIPALDGWDLTQMDVGTGASKFDLFLELEERADTIAGRVIYSDDLFEADTIRRMIDGLTALLAAAAADPARSLGDLPLMSPQEVERVLRAWNDTDLDCPPLTVHAAFESQARRRPGAIAAEFEDGETWTYARLDARADRLAARLKQAGAGRGVLVAICLERSLEMVAATLAVMKTGAAWLPLDPAFPPARLKMLVAEAGAELALTRSDLAARLPVDGLRLVLSDEVRDGAGRPRRLAVRVDPEDPAYVIFTSGSTGKPKAVEIRHRSVTSLVAALQRQPGFGKGDSMLALAPLTFDACISEMFAPLLSGGRTIVATRETAVDPARLLAVIQATGVNTMFATPTTWRALLDEGWSGSARLRVLCGGEVMQPELAERLLPRCAELWNMYGPTETTVYAMMHRVVPGEGLPPIGLPIGGVRAHVLDAAGALAPIGVTGELYIGGAGVGRGYRNREDLTRERFVMRAAVPGERLYRTGDMVRRRPDGKIEFVGRRDGQVKVRGFRIEPGEVEAALESLPEVAAAAVKPWSDPSGGLSLAAYVVGSDGVEPDPAGLRRSLRALLPDFMIPAAWVVLPAMPLTTSGKIDRGALPEPRPVAVEAGFAEPRGELETRLAAIWREVLGVPRVGAQDNFFDLGGHSILVARLLRRVEAEFGRRLTIPEVFRAPDVRRMAVLLSGAASEPVRSRANEVQPQGSRPPLFWLNAGALFWPLAQALGADQPFLGVRRDPTVPLPDVFELAELAPQMIAVIREISPQGPYYLGGWCAWGVLAWEVAQQLTAAGCEVGLVVMLDPPHPGQRREIGRLSLAASKLRLHLAQAARRRGRERWAYLRERVDMMFARVSVALDTADVGLQSRFGATIGKACLRYEPKPYDGDVALFVPSERPDVFDPATAWAPLVRGDFSACELTGDHVGLLRRPQVTALGEAMGEALRRAQGRTRRDIFAAE